MTNFFITENTFCCSDRLTTKKLSDVELEREELSTKFDEANQTIGVLQFEKLSWLNGLRSLKWSCFKLELN